MHTFSCFPPVVWFFLVEDEPNQADEEIYLFIFPSPRMIFLKHDMLHILLD